MILLTQLTKMEFSIEKSFLRVEKHERSRNKMKKLKGFDWNKKRKNCLRKEEERKHRSRSKI